MQLKGQTLKKLYINPIINTKGTQLTLSKKNCLSCFDEWGTHGDLPLNQIRWWMISITEGPDFDNIV